MAKITQHKLKNLTHYMEIIQDLRKGPIIRYGFAE